MCVHDRLYRFDVIRNAVLRGRDLAADDALILTTQDIASGLKLLQESNFPIQSVQVNRFAGVRDDSARAKT